MKNLKEEVYVKGYEQVRRQVRIHVNRQHRAYVYDEVYEHLCEYLRIQIYERVRILVREHTC